MKIAMIIFSCSLNVIANKDQTIVSPTVNHIAHQAPIKLLIQAGEEGYITKVALSLSSTKLMCSPIHFIGQK